MTDIPLKASLRHCRGKDCVTLRHISLLFSPQSTQIWWHLTISGNRRKWSNFNSFWSPNVFVVSTIPCWSTWSTEASYLQVRPYPPFPFSGQCTTQVIMSSWNLSFPHQRMEDILLGGWLTFLAASACLTKTLQTSDLRVKLCRLCRIRTLRAINYLWVLKCHLPQIIFLQK